MESTDEAARGWLRCSTLLLVALAACDRSEESPRNRKPAGPAGDPALPSGFWFAAEPRPDIDLGHIGYAEGTRPSVPGAAEGAEIHDPSALAPGLNLYCSGHAPEARLIDAEGVTVRRWSVDYDSLAGVPPLRHSTQRAWRRVRLMPDGGLLALHEALVLLRLDAESRVLWSVGLGAHHDFDVDREGRVHLLVRRAVEVPAIAGGRTIVDDGVAVLGPDGTLLRQVSILAAFAASPWAFALDEAAVNPRGRSLDPGDGLARDLMHVNAYNLLEDVPPGMPAAFVPGRALISLRELDALAVLDLESETIVWFLRGALDGPHDPEVDSEGKLWVFDNGLQRGWSRAVRLDPHTGRELAQWPRTRDESFHSEVCGALQLLPGGNLLLTESTAGRAFEVTPDGKIAWTFASPHRVQGPNGPLIACLFEVERIAPEQLPPGLR